MNDTGYYMGSGDGLLYFPPKESEDYKDGKPIVIPWEEVLDEPVPWYRKLIRRLVNTFSPK